MINDFERKPNETVKYKHNRIEQCDGELINND
jgi:hypothetical protein